MKNVFKTIWNWIVFILTGKGEIANEAIDEGLIDYSGQGRDKYGHTIVDDDTTDKSRPKHKNKRGPLHGRFDDLCGRRIGMYDVLEFDHMKHVGSGKSTLSYYKCQCHVCGRIFIKSRSALMTAQGAYHQSKCE